jgi:hypothetical protein
MSKKVFDQDDSKSIDQIRKVDSTNKREKSGEDNLVTTLRSDMLLTSSTSPMEKSFFERINLKYVFGILLTLFIIIFVWFMLGGPGRPILENGLALLIHTDATPTQAVVSSVVIPTATRPQPSNTPVPTPTLHPTSTPTSRLVATRSTVPPTVTPTAVPACRDALTITLADMGQTLCVQGTIIKTVEQPNAFMVIFSKKPGSFYWVTYDLVWSKAELDTCYQTKGKIEQLGNSAILIFDYSNLPELCP